MKFIDLANPTRFLSITAALMPYLIGLTVLAFAVGLYMAFFVAPPDYQQGETVRIMFVHVPAAWLSMFCYTIMAASALGTLVWKHPLADVSAKAAAPIGAVFTFLALATGSLWGKPMWGTWWVWDARLTSVLVLFLMYLGLIALWQAIDDQIAAGKLCAKVILVGFINVPIIKFSVDWWNTLHQPASVIRLGGSTIHSSILWPLLILALAFSLLFLVLHFAAMRTEIMRRRVHRLRRVAADESMESAGA